VVFADPLRAASVEARAKAVREVHPQVKEAVASLPDLITMALE
jgi:hypothetical protein